MVVVAELGAPYTFASSQRRSISEKIVSGRTGTAATSEQLFMVAWLDRDVMSATPR